MDKSFFRGNRDALLQAVEGKLVIVTGYNRVQRSNDAAHPFTQEANFWYLTGIEEPDWTVVIDGSQNKSWLIMPDISDIHRTFDGGLSPEDAKGISDVDKVVTKDEALKLIRDLAKKHSLVYTVAAPPYSDHFNFNLNPSITRNWQNLERQFNQVQDIQKELAKLRAIKQPEEIAMIQRAINATIKGFEHVRTNMNTYKQEHEVDADISWTMRKAGAKGHAYDPIIAAGGNACTLHYSHNNSAIKNRQLVLMDVGASYGGYAADITRTYVKGSPTKRQLAVHAAVEAAHQQIIALIRPSLSVEEYHASVDEIMLATVASLGLGEGNDAMRKYFPHAISHGLGIDVHDSLGVPKYLIENMVLTVEPGIYIPEEEIGVRIEDDVLVTANGYKNLSGALSTGL